MARLGKIDWITAGFRALTAAGPQALVIEKIAVDLGVSKGSFYWHFKNLKTFKADMIEHWASAGTKQLIDNTTQSQADPAGRLSHLIAQIAGSDISKYDGPSAETAIRDWAKYDPAVAAKISAIDDIRLSFVTAQFCEAGQDNPVAKQSARIMYAALIGLESMPHHQSLKRDLDRLLSALL